MTRDVLFAPYYAKNPYQSRLAEELRRHDVVVRGVEPVGKELPPLDAALRSRRPDLLHLHWLHPFFLAPDVVRTMWRALRFVARLHRLRAEGTPVVWTVHNLRNHDGRHPGLDHRTTLEVARLADAIICHDEAARALVLQTFGDLPAEKLHVVPHAHYIGDYPNRASRADARRELGIAEDRLVYLFLGRVRGYKGVFELLEAFQSADLPTTSELVVAGKATEDRVRVRLKRRCKKAERVTLHYGHVEDERLQHYFGAADVCVLPYRDVLTSGAAVLAMSFGKPIVAPSVGGLAELLDPDGAWLYDPTRPGALPAALALAARTSPEQRAAMGDHNRRRAEASSPAAAAAAHAAVYEAAGTRALAAS